MSKTKRSWAFWFLIFNSSFTGMISQMLLGYAVGIVTGALYKQYSLIMGLFVFFMGLGAFLFQTTKRATLTLALLQVASPILVYSIWLITKTSFIEGGANYSYWLQILAIAAIGLMSGGELPLIDRMTRGEGHSDYDRILFFDYLAMSFATAFFGIYLLTTLGAPGTILLISTGHAATLIVTVIHQRTWKPA